MTLSVLVRLFPPTNSSHWIKRSENSFSPAIQSLKGESRAADSIIVGPNIVAGLAGHNGTDLMLLANASELGVQLSISAASS